MPGRAVGRALNALPDVRCRGRSRPAAGSAHRRYL